MDCIEISIKRNDNKCLVYDDKKRIELGTCDYEVVREVLGHSLKNNVRQQFGLSQVTLDKLNLQNEMHTDLHTSQKSKDCTKPVNKNKIQYISANCTPEEEAELQHQLAESNRETRQREQHAIDKSNGNQIRVNTHSLK